MEDNFNFKKYLAEGRLLKEELTPLQQYVYDYEKEVSGEDNAKEFLDGIKKLNTPNDVYDYYAFERNWEGDSDLEGDLENIYNQVLDKFKSKNENKMNNFNLKKYLAEGKLLKEDANSIVNLLIKNQREVAEKLNYMEYFPFDEVNIDLEGDASIVLQDEAGGLSFRYPEDVDSKFVGQDGDKPRPVTIGGVDLMYIGYNI